MSSFLALRALLRSALTASGLADGHRAVAGLAPGARALYLAGRAHAASDAMVVAVVPRESDVEPLARDTRFFLAALEGLSDAAAAEAVLPLPSNEVDPYRGLAPHLRVASARARALIGAATGRARVIVASPGGLLPRVADPDALLRVAIDLRTGMECSPVTLAELLAEAGFERADPVDAHGEFTVRGGIVDVYPAGEADPYRLEFAGDIVESIRRFDASTQRTIATTDHAAILPLADRIGRAPHPALAAGAPPATAADYLTRRRQAAFLVVEPDEVREAAARLLEQAARSYDDLATGTQTRPDGALAPPESLFAGLGELERWLDGATRLSALDIERGDGADAGTRHVECQPVVEFRSRVQDWVAEVRQARASGDTVVFVAETRGRAERMLELAREYGLSAVLVADADEVVTPSLLVAVGALTRGFRLVAGRLRVYAEGDVFEEERRAPERRRTSAARAFLSDLRDLKPGDLVVHVDHGIGAFVGLREIAVGPGDPAQEFLQVRYAGDDKLFVPVERLDLVQKYTGGARPPLDRLGGTSWERAKTRVRKAMRDMAEELLKLYAARKTVAGHAFNPDTHWQQEFEQAFPYDLTPDQETAIADIKADMEAPTPMDRLLCGDVGYGKTEVAMRAAFKAVMDGKQVAVLAPTTVLAFQHAKTLGERFAAFPVRIDLISRFRSKAEQKAVVADLAAGRIDIVVGTHRLLSKDIAFKDLGLLVVDEEQRFGVAHKERIKQLRRRVDVLTLTATPIPRTLNMALVGIRDMSVIETPPKDRLAIQTHVVKFDSEVIRRAVRYELARGGQVYLVHNRVESIFSIANLVARLVPEARIAVGHGQVQDDALEKTMLDFMAHAFDVLVATTIVENGLDIPNANTIIVNRADRYGLSQLYQLRGRVGRSDRAAYAFLLIPPEEALSPVAKKRLAAIREFSELGSGFRVAALDLEIRGAGNLLGGEQSGHIDAVGFEMYMKLLEEAVRQLKGEEVEEATRATVNLHVDLRIDETYITDMNQRLAVYRRVAAAREVDALDHILAEVRDRYGPLPDSLLNLADYGRIRILADRLGVEAIDREGQWAVFRFRAQANVEPARLVALVQERQDVRLVPPSGLRLDLKSAAGRVVSPRSWWTVRARAGQVTGGFTRAELLRPERHDPRGEQGVFARVGGLLSELVAPG